VGSEQYALSIFFPKLKIMTEFAVSLTVQNLALVVKTSINVRKSDLGLEFSTNLVQIAPETPDGLWNDFYGKVEKFQKTPGVSGESCIISHNLSR